MTAKRLKRPRDPFELAKLIGDIATGQIEDKKTAPSIKPSKLAPKAKHRSTSGRRKKA